MSGEKIKADIGRSQQVVLSSEGVVGVQERVAYIHSGRAPLASHHITTRRQGQPGGGETGGRVSGVGRRLPRGWSWRGPWLTRHRGSCGPVRPAGA